MRSRRRRVLQGAAVFLVAAAVASGAVWFLTAPTGPRVPATALFADDASAAIRLSRPDEAYDRYWAGRGGREGALDAIARALDAAGEWEPLLEEMTESDARAAIGDAIDRLFALVGGETWIVFGGSNVAAAPSDSPDRSPRPALLVLTAADTRLKANFDPVARLFLSGEKLSVARVAGAKIRLYGEPGEAGAVAWTLLDGWVCVAFGPDAPGALDTLARRRAGAAPAPLPADPAGPPRTVHARISPAAFARDRAAVAEGGDEDPLVALARGFEAYDRVVLSTSDSGISMELTPRGVAGEDEGDPPVPAPEPARSPTPAGIDPPPPAILQMDFARDFASEAASLAGADWSEIFDRLAEFDWVHPGLVAEARARLATASEPAPDGAAPSRIGWALLPDRASATPAAALWEDFAPLRATDVAPADAWRIAERDGGLAPDAFLRFGEAVYDAPTAGREASARRAATDAFWNAGPPPAAFVAADFAEMAESVRAFPAIVLGKDEREAWRRFGALCDALDLTVGAAALRVDREGDRLVARFAPLGGAAPAARPN